MQGPSFWKLGRDLLCTFRHRPPVTTCSERRPRHDSGAPSGGGRAGARAAARGCSRARDPRRIFEIPSPIHAPRIREVHGYMGTLGTSKLPVCRVQLSAGTTVCGYNCTRRLAQTLYPCVGTRVQLYPCTSRVRSVATFFSFTFDWSMEILRIR